jgi:hypothetical protein
MSAKSCAQCGASSGNGAHCRARFEQLLAFDFSNPAYGRVHHLVVTTYSAQHAQGMTDDAVAAYDHALAQYARTAETDPDGHGLRHWLYNHAGKAFAGAARVRADHPAVRARPQWSRTVFDVDVTSADAYRRTVSAWAASVGRDLEGFQG